MMGHRPRIRERMQWNEVFDTGIPGVVQAIQITQKTGYQSPVIILLDSRDAIARLKVALNHWILKNTKI